LIYFPDQDQFLSSKKAYERYAFDSYYTAAVPAPGIQGLEPDANGITVVRSYDYTREIQSFAVEAAAYAIGFKKIYAGAGIRKWIAPVYALSANGISFMAGMWISYYWPGIF